MGRITVLFALLTPALAQAQQFLTTDGVQRLPEPSAIALIVIGAAVAGLAARKKK